MYIILIEGLYSIFRRAGVLFGVSLRASLEKNTKTVEKSIVYCMNLEYLTIQYN